jgi:hypothetical protein
MITQQETMTFRPTLAARFGRYDKEHPVIWRLFCAFTKDAIRAGHKSFSARSIVERIRWETSVQWHGEFKINNSFAAFYARKFHKENPHLDGFFRTRHSSADRYNTYPRSLACTAIVWLFTIGTIGIVGLLAVGA